MELYIFALIAIFAGLLLYNLCVKREGLTNTSIPAKKSELNQAKSRATSLKNTLDQYDGINKNLSTKLDFLENKVNCATQKTSSLTSGRQGQAADLKQTKDEKANQIKAFTDSQN